MYDLIIKNGSLVNFEENKLIVMDIGIKENKIVAIEKCLDNSKKIIDAKDKIVSPGFVDLHMHEEIIGNSSGGDDYDISNKMLKMGVTTCVGGNCGNNRQTVEEFFDFIDKNGSPVNYMLFTGHNFYRNQLDIDRYREATEEEIQLMSDFIIEDIEKNGAIGLSFGIEYSPGVSFHEILELCNSIKKYDVLLSAHYRADAGKGIESVKELIRISELTGLPMQISHIGSCTAMGQMRESLDIIKEAIARGTDIKVDCYPYDAFSTYIGSSVFDDGCFENWNKSYDSILLTEEPYKNVRCDEEIFNKVRREYPKMLAVAFVMNEDEIIEALKESFVYVASDGILNKGQGHPRASGTFPKVIGRYVREESKLELMDQLKKMTKLPAERLKLKEKGELKVGMDADIVIFDYDKIIDCATFSDQTREPLGIEYVLISGKIALEKGKIVENRLGKAIKRIQNKSRGD